MVVNSQTKVPLDLADVRAFVRKLSGALWLDWEHFNVCFVDDRTIQRLNAEFRGKPRPTDVLSFLWTPGEASLQTERVMTPQPARYARHPLPRGEGCVRLRLPAPFQGRGLSSTSSFCSLPEGEGGRRPGEGFGKRDSKSQTPGWGDEFKGFLGDIVISTETARRNAALAGHSTRREIRVLILHGLLHLLGYDHERDHGEMTRLELSLRGRARIAGPSRASHKSRIKKQEAKTKTTGVR